MWINNKGYLQERVVDPHTGLLKTVSVKVSGKGEKARQEAFTALQDKIRRMNETRFRLAEVIELYLKESALTMKPSSLTRKESHFRSIVSILGNPYVDSLTAGYIRMKFAESGKSNRTLNDYQETFKAFWRWAYRNDFMKSTEVADKLSILPDQSVKERIQDKYLEPEELQELLEALPEKRDVLLVKFLVLTGCRASEAIALNDDDIVGDYVRINKNYDHLNNIVTTPKTVTSRREIYIQPELKDLIQEMREYVLWEKKVFSFQTGIFFPDIDGNYYKYARFNSHVAKTAQKVLGRKATTHIFRATHCSMLVAKGMSFESISARLGHENSKITKEIYFHRLKELREAENRQLDNIRILG